MVVRQAPEEALGAARALARTVGLPLVAAAGVILLLGCVLARWLAAPIGRLAEAAMALAEGRLDRPVPEARSTREAAMLAAALARLDRDGPPGAPRAGGAK